MRQTLSHLKWLVCKYFGTADGLDAIVTLWGRSALKRAYDERRSSALSSAEYYFTHVKRFAESDFLCTDEDVPCMFLATAKN